MEDEHGKLTTHDTGKADLLNKLFCSVFTTEDTNIIPNFIDRTIANTLTDISYKQETIADKLKGLKVNKSPGPDGHHPLILKEIAEAIAEPLSIIFNKSFNEGCLPEAWKEAHVIPLFKKGKKSQPGNYRPVSLTSIVCKIMESITRDNLIIHMNSNNLFSNCQHGFIKNRSCTTNLLTALDQWTDAIDQGSAVDVIYFDFAKAFDTVPHSRLLNKLQGYGIHGKAAEWVRQFLKDRRQRVVIKGTKSDWGKVTSGLPQGSVLGPILFVLFINDLPDDILSSIVMFADDTKLWSKVNNTEDRAALQFDIDKLATWSNDWQLSFNADKCKSLHLGHNNHEYQYSMPSTVTRKPIEKTNLEKDLGVNIDAQLKFSKHIKIQVNKANKILGMIRRSYEFLDGDSLKRLFIALVRPHLEYSNAVWSPRYIKDGKSTT